MNDINKSQPISQSTYHETTFEQWADALNGIYGKRNQGRSPSDMWLRAVSDASKVGEAIRKNEYGDAIRDIAHTFGWIITTCNKLLEMSDNGHPALQMTNQEPHTTVTGIILGKYTAWCPYCGEVPCACPSMRRTLEQESKKSRRERLRKIRQEALARVTESGELPINVAGISAMFEDIYGEIHYGVQLEKITFHFLEEIGEVGWCITRACMQTRDG